MRSHLSDFKKHRAARIDHYVVEVNKLIIRLEKVNFAVLKHLFPTSIYFLGENYISAACVMYCLCWVLAVSDVGREMPHLERHREWGAVRARLVLLEGTAQDDRLAT